MRHLLLSVLALSGISQAAPGVLVEADQDTVLKVRYTGGSPNTSHPAATVAGKRVGLLAKAQYGGGNPARPLIGEADGLGHTFYAPSGSSIGVVGVGSIGMFAYGSIGMDAKAGYVGISAEDAGGEIAVYGTSTGLAGYFDGNVYVTGTVTEGSDLALKENVRPLGRGLSTVMALKPKAYEMKSGISKVTSKGTRFGLIAQELQAQAPELVQTTKLARQRNSSGVLDTVTARREVLSVNYTGLIPVLIKAMQEQQAEIDELKRRLDAK